MKLKHLILAAAAACSISAQAQTSLNLSNYSVTGTYTLDRFNGASGGLSGLGSLCGGDEASKADGLGGEIGGGERLVRLREGPGWGGKPERQMSHT